VIWVGDQVIGAYWREQGGGFHFNVARGGQINYEHIPPQALSLVSELAQALEINHAGFDVAMVDGYPMLLECNLLFGLGGLNRSG